LADDRSVDALSVEARIGCAKIVVITNFLSVLASFYSIARSNGTFVSAVAGDWSVFNTVVDGAEIFCACIVIIKLVGSQRSVFASIRRIAGVNSARIVIVTINRGVDTFCLIERASINGTNVVVIAILSSVVCKDTSSLRIARFVSARILVITNNQIVMNNSGGCITVISCAFVVVINIDWGEDTSSRVAIASVGSARILVIAYNRGLDNSDITVASNGDAFVAVVENDWNVLASNVDIAGINCASIVVVAIDCNVLASLFNIAGINCASIVVIAIDCNVLASLFSVTSVASTSIVVIADYLGVSTSCVRAAIVVCASVVVVAINWNMRNNSSDDIARFSGAFVSITQMLRGKHASFFSITSVDSARIVIITNFLYLDTSFNCIATINCACVVVSTDDWSMLASKDWMASVNGARIVIIAILLFRIIANSINTFVDGANVIVNAFYSFVNTFVRGSIASVNGARVTIITSIQSHIFVSNKSG
jgi:hypothetical protein